MYDWSLRLEIFRTFAFCLFCPSLGGFQDFCLLPIAFFALRLEFSETFAYCLVPFAFFALRLEVFKTFAFCLLPFAFFAACF